MKAVLTTKVDPHYDDLPEVRYHFPRTYLRQMEAAVGDWAIYYEPRRSNENLGSSGGRQAYFATAKIDRIASDMDNEDHFYAFVSDYLPFDHAVPFREGSFYFESMLKRDDGKTSKGAFGRSVRNVPDDQYDLILQAGFARVLSAQSIPENIDPAGRQIGFEQEQTPFVRPIVETPVARPFRDAAFAIAVKAAYGDTCAMTGLKIINGGGRAEVQAAHIRPVAHQGSDSVRNGMALSGTAHWMFDRGLISVDDDYSILVAKDRLPDTVGRLLREDRKLLLPNRADWRPHETYLRYHRHEIFKG